VRPFTQDEYDQRVMAVRAGMAARGLDLLVVTVPENVTYLTGYETIGYASFQTLAVPLAGDLLLIVREMERTVAETTAWVPSVETFSDTDDPVDVTRRVLSSRRLVGGRVGLEDQGWFLSPAVHARLRAALGERVEGGSGLVEAVRRIKSPAEVELIRSACRLTEAGMQAALETIAPGRTENQVAAAAYATMVGGGSDFLVGDPIVTSGWRSGVGHFTFANRVLEPGDAVLLEFGACRRRGLTRGVRVRVWRRDRTRPLPSAIGLQRVVVGCVRDKARYVPAAVEADAQAGELVQPGRRGRQQGNDKRQVLPHEGRSG